MIAFAYGAMIHFEEMPFAARDAQLVAAILFIAGFVTFMIGAVGWKFDYQAALPDAMKAWHRDASRIRWIHLWMVPATLLAISGTIAFREFQSWAQEPLWATIASTLWIVGGVLMLAALIWRVTVVADIARRTSETGSVPEGAAALHSFGGWIFWLHLVLSHAATMLFGISIVQTGVLPHWLGWFGILFGASLALGNLAQVGPLSPPFLVHVWFVVLAVVLLVNLP
ncbi:MAG TPA: DUF4386 family protein [Actinomycetota bacterium]|nr:DUF4386 family protein [Actinomycetota bacterium]